MLRATPPVRRAVCARRSTRRAVSDPSGLGRSRVAVILSRLDVLERDEALPRFIPERQTREAEALHDIDAIESAKRGVVPEHLGQPIKWNPAREVVDVVDADIAGEPAQGRRQR